MDDNALRNSLSLLETLIDTIPNPVFYKDRQGVYRGCNEAFANQIIGVTKEKIIGCSLFDLPDAIPSDLAEIYHQKDLELIENTGTQFYDAPVQCADGLKRDFLFNKATYTDAKGAVAGMIGIMVDITERKQTSGRSKRLNRLNEGLLVSGRLNDKLRLITEEIIKIFKADFARIWMIKPGDLCDFECIHAKVTEKPNACRYRELCLHLVASSGRYTHIDGGHRRVPFGSYKIGRVAAGDEPKFLTNDVVNDPLVGDHEWARKLGLVSFAGYRLLSADKGVVGVLALFSKQVISPEEDALIENLAVTTAQIIQTATAEEALRESEEKYRVLFESSRDAIMTLAPPTWLFTSANPATIALFKVRDEAEFVSFGPWQLSPERQPDGKPSDEKAKEMIETAMRNGFHFFEWTHCQSDGTPFPAEVLLTRMEQRGQMFLQATVRDFTERKQAEEQREELISDLQKALSEVKTLRGFLPICSYCKNVRDDKGYWSKIESYIHKHSDAEFSHGICPECAKKHYPDMDLSEDAK